ncbi:MAG: DEAD/DEAH box helicase, partial [Campylobacterota bacterium]|nr:DEAD/DEAH box helicase [Campylobacterota bacterium]
MYYYQVTLLRSSAPYLTYESHSVCSIGSVVTVPLKSTFKEAVILKEVEKPSFETTVIHIILDKMYTSKQLEIAQFMSEYYFSSLSEAISLFIPYRVGINPSVDLLDENHIPIPLIHQGQAQGIAPTLTPQQQQAYEELLQKKKALLFGVTGSGKTEIFISLMAKMLEEGKTCIFLMPEISLTPQMERRLQVYFGESVAMWHSKLTKKKKESILKGIEVGSVQIVAGARSALFVPLTDLGLIIVDEEHDDSYKSMTRPRYHARDVAVLMGSRLGAKVVLASATPSVTSYYKYDVVKLAQP